MRLATIPEKGEGGVNLYKKNGRKTGAAQKQYKNLGGKIILKMFMQPIKFRGSDVQV